jgi:hypothetical protein
LLALTPSDVTSKFSPNIFVTVTDKPYHTEFVGIFTIYLLSTCHVSSSNNALCSAKKTQNRHTGLIKYQLHTSRTLPYAIIRCGNIFSRFRKISQMFQMLKLKTHTELGDFTIPLYFLSERKVGQNVCQHDDLRLKTGVKSSLETSRALSTGMNNVIYNIWFNF